MILQNVNRMFHEQHLKEILFWTTEQLGFVLDVDIQILSVLQLNALQF